MAKIETEKKALESSGKVATLEAQVKIAMDVVISQDSKMAL